VTNEQSQAIRHSLDRFVKVNPSDGLSQLAEARAILEPEIAALAASRRDEQQVSAMRDAVTAMDESRNAPDAYIQADLDFHLALAEAAGNQIILSLVDSVVGLLRAQRIRIFQSEGGPERGQFHHKRILEAVEQRDPARARQFMRAHLEQVGEDSTSPSRQ
jgi:GntR family transcriptional regulator, transcriptional repressor for pyruvate dehydrogenase complex